MWDGEGNLWSPSSANELLCGGTGVDVGVVTAGGRGGERRGGEERRGEGRGGEGRGDQNKGIVSYRPKGVYKDGCKTHTIDD